MDSPMIASLESCLERQRQRPRALTFALRHPVLVAGSFLLALMIALALFAPWIVPHDPTEMNVIQRLKPPSAEFPLGTDALGRDILSRTLYGARVSLLVGVSVALFSALTGILIGTMAGFNRLADKIIMRFMDGMMAIPGILLAVAIVVHHQQGVYGEATDERQHHHIHIQRIGLHVVGAAYGHEAEEHQHQYVAPAPIGEQRGIEESKQYAHHAQHHQFPASVGQLPPDGEQHCQPCQARQCQCDADAGFHGCRRNPTFGAGALRPQPVFPTVGPFLEVEEVVDKVGGNLHAAGKEGAQQGGCGLELSVAEGKGTAQQYR